MDRGDTMLLYGLGGIAVGGVALWLYMRSQSQAAPAAATVSTGPGQLPTVTPPTFPPSGGYSPFSFTQEPFPAPPQLQAANIAGSTINVAAPSFASPDIIAPGNITFNIPAVGPAPAAGNIIIQAPSLGSPTVTGANLTAGGGPNPSPGSADAVTPTCGCGGPPPYAGNTATQAGTLAGQISAAMGAAVQNLSNPPIAPAQAPPTPTAVSSVAQSYGVVAPSAFDAAFGTASPIKLYAMQALTALTGSPAVPETIH